MQDERVARTLARQHLADAAEDGVLVLLDEKCQNGAELLAGIGPRRPGLRLVCQQHGRGLRHGHARHARHGTGRPADDLRIDRAVRAEQQPRHAPGLLRVQEIAALLPEFLADAGLAAALDDNALLRGADRAVVERLRAENVPHGPGDVGRAVDIGRAVARADADGGLAGRIGRADHGPAACGQDEAHLRGVQQLLHGVQGRHRQAGDRALRASGGLGGLRHEAGGVERAAHGVRMGREDDGTARLQGDEGFVDHGGRRVRRGHDARDDADGHADVPDAALVVPPQDADGAQAPDGPEHADGGEAVLLRLVALIAEACFGAGLPRQLRRVQGARAGQRLRDAVEAALVQFLQALEGQLRLLRQQADLLPGAQIAVKFHGRSSLFLLLPAAGPPPRRPPRQRRCRRQGRPSGCR